MYKLCKTEQSAARQRQLERGLLLIMQTKRYEPVPMPVRYVKEMFCDRVAASKIYQGKNYTDSSALDYYLRGRARDKMHPATADQLEEWLIMLKEKGEKETFRHIRKISNR